MLKTGDDLPKLFRSLGNNDVDLRSVGSMALRDAEQRWPLLKAMPPKEPPQAPLLTAEEKQSWQTQAHEMQARRDPVASPPSLGDKLALSLKKIATQAKTEQSPKKSRAKPAVAVADPEQNPAPAPEPHKAPVASLAVSQQDVSQPTRPKKKAVETINKPESKSDVPLEAIWGKKEVTAEMEIAHSPSTDDSLKSIFGRLEPVKKETKSPIAEKRPSYLGRLGRK